MHVELSSVLELLRIIASVVFAFGLVILFHEVGHLVMGKIAGVGVPAFAIGMGPELFGFDFGGTRYKVCLFPIGGYCKMIGEDEEVEEGYNPEESIQNKHPLFKIGIFFAGPFMNYVLAVLLFSITLFFWGVPREIPEWTYRQPSKSVIVKFIDVRKEAGKVGIKIGDRILEVDGVKVAQVDQVTKTMWSHPGKKVRIKIDRGGHVKSFTVTPRLNKATKQGLIGVVLGIPTPRLVQKIAKGSPAEKAGIRAGDYLLDADGRELTGESYRMPASSSIILVADRKGEPRPVALDAARAGIDSGLALAPLYQRIGPFTAIELGARGSVRALGQVAMSLGWIFQRKVSSDDMAGPVGIVQYMADFAKRDLRDFIDFVALISMTLALVNLLPIPALDGSRIVFSVIELIIGKPVSPKYEGMIHYAGFIVLMGLIALITFNDIMQLVRR